MTKEQHAFTEKAHRTLESARSALGSGDPESAVDRAYYAAFYMATAALLSLSERPKTHSGTHIRFHLHFVRTDRLDRSTGATLQHAFELRQRATYEAFAVFDEASASHLIRDVERFIERVDILLNQPEKDKT